MGQIFSIASQKGGVGKTTTALNLGVAFARSNRKVLIIDADPQGGIVYSLNKHPNSPFGLYQVFCGEAEILDGAQPTELENLFVMDSGIPNSNSKIQAFEDATRATGLFRESVLNAAPYYDLILIDCPPGIGLISTGALIASDYAIIPLQSEPLSLRTFPQLLHQLIDIKKNTNHSIEIAGVLLTMFDDNSMASQIVHEEVRNYFTEDLVFETSIPRDTSLNLLYTGNKNLPDALAELESTSEGLQAYYNLAEEINFKFFSRSSNELIAKSF